MSHVAQFETSPGKPLITDMKALEMACKNLGLEIRKDNKYKWFMRHVGDYPLPPGWKKEDMGTNAEFVIRPSAATCQEKGINAGQVYELGVVPDKNNPGNWTLMYDFYNSGYGLDKVVGKPIMEGRGCKQVAPTVVQHYRMCCDALTAKEVGDEIEFQQEKDGSWTSYTYPNEERLRAKL